MSRPVALVEYLVRIVPPTQDTPNEVMDKALRRLRASLEYNDNLRRLVEERFVAGVDVLGAAGFAVEVVKL